MPDQTFTARKIRGAKQPPVPTVTLRIPLELKAAVRQAAEKQHRNLSSQCFHYIQEGLLRDLENGGAQ